MKEKNAMLQKVLFSFAATFLLVLTMSLTVKAAAPGKVSGLKQTGASDSSISVSWNAVLGADNYALWMSEDGKNWGDEPIEDATYGTGKTVYGLTAGHTYYVKVCAYKGYYWHYPDSSENGEFSDVLEVTTATANVEDLKVTEASVDSISVSWLNTDGASYYEVSYRNSKSDTYTVAGTTTTPVYKVKNLKPDESYNIKVIPVRKSSVGYLATAHEGVLNVWQCNTMLAGSAHKDLTVEAWAGNSKEVTLKWTTNSSNIPSGYQIQICDAKKKVISTYTTKSSVTSVKFSNKKIKNKAFQFRVRSYQVINNNNSYGTWSSYKVVVPTCKVTASKKGNGAKLSWNKVSGATSYTIYYSSSSYNGKLKKRATVKGNSYTWKNLKRNKDYYVYVKANNVKFGKKKYSSTTAKYQKIYEFWIGSSKAFNYIYTKSN